ncbi:M28 family peptidase [Aquimarina sp. MMG016]|uniref:M28 family metallopeptidase n=1 Tax=Aquimarina sp. MMG016 TaxID=2822690 RepID=UPI001B39FA52|nr:M28 family peptidase [Aquimarina sp. MMG016]MBQ4818999.1 M20/M25/M40 family metallo-hydrolase [Aquimarina sp. MMG016]
MNKAILTLLFFSSNIINVFCQNTLIEEQKEIVSILTGETKYQGNTLESRYTEEERKIVRTYLNEKIKNLSLEVKEHSYTFKNPYPDRQPESFNGENTYTIIPSTTNSNEFIILGAHFDSVQNCPGANDNATGVAMAYSIAKKINEVSKRDKSIILVFFDQEEWGLIGSRAFAEYIKKEGFNIHSVHTIDQMGWDEDNDKAIELELPTRELEKIYTTQAEKFNIPIYVTEVNSTDHQAFREVGFKAIGITEEYEHNDTTPFYHSHKDTYETINFEYLASSTELVYNVLKSIVNTKN